MNNNPPLSAFETEEEIASRYGVVPDIHPEDLLFRFVLNHSCHPTRMDAVRFYFSTGYSSAKLLEEIILGQGIAPNFTMLEFASGYGCVTRHLKNVFPECSILASDIHPQAVSFIQSKIEVKAVESHVMPESLKIDGVFDVAFALSFFSHMPEKTWSRWLNALARRVKPGGILIFTTHGCASRLVDPRNLDRQGIWFRPQSDQGDLPWSDYGTTATSFRYVLSQVSQIPGARVIRFHEGLWWGLQDLYVLRVDEESVHPATPTDDRRHSLGAEDVQLARRLESAYEDLNRLTVDITRLIAEVRDRDQRLVAAGQGLSQLTVAVQDRDQLLIEAESNRRRLAERLQRIEASLVWRIYNWTRRTGGAVLNRLRR